MFFTFWSVVLNIKPMYFISLTFYSLIYLRLREVPYLNLNFFFKLLFLVFHAGSSVGGEHFAMGQTSSGATS